MMGFQGNILAFPAARVLAAGAGERGDSMAELPQLRRPRLLVAAARHGQQGYRRARDLRRLMQGAEEVPPSGRALAWLVAREAQMDEARRAARPDWEVQQHVLLLIALLAEMRLARESGGPGASVAGPRLPGVTPGGGRLRRLSGL